MPTTPNRGYPTPAGTVPPNGPLAFSELAGAVDTALQDLTDETTLSFDALPVVQAGRPTVTVTSGTSSGSRAVTFPVAFETVPAVTLTINETNGPASSARRLNAVAHSITATGFTATLQTVDGSNVGATFATPTSWVAVELAP